MRAAGFRPKEMFDRPSVVCTSGWRRLSSRIASMVAMPSLRDSSWPVQMVKVRVSMRMSDSWMPQLPVRSAMSRSAMATLCSAVRAWPSSSMVSAISAAPCSAASAVTLREAGLGAVAVLVVDGVDDRAAAELLQAGPEHVELGGVQHDRQGGGGGEPAGELGHVGDAVAAHVVDAQVEHVGALADLVAGHLHAVVPAAFQHGLAELLRAVGVGALADREVRGVLAERAPSGRARRHPARGAARARSASVPRTRSTTWRRCSGVVPQQPPTRERPYSRTNVSCASARSSGVSG